MAHVGYDIAEIGPFLDAAEAAAPRLCVAVHGRVGDDDRGDHVLGTRSTASRASDCRRCPSCSSCCSRAGGCPRCASSTARRTAFASIDEAHVAWRAASCGCARGAPRTSSCASWSRHRHRTRRRLLLRLDAQRRSASSAGSRVGDRAREASAHARTRLYRMMGRAAALALYRRPGRGADIRRAVDVRQLGIRIGFRHRHPGAAACSFTGRNGNFLRGDAAKWINVSRCSWRSRLGGVAAFVLGYLL